MEEEEEEEEDVICSVACTPLLQGFYHDHAIFSAGVFVFGNGKWCDAEKWHSLQVTLPISDALHLAGSDAATAYYLVSAFTAFFKTSSTEW